MSVLHLSSNRLGFGYNAMKLKPNYQDNRHFSLINNLDMKELNNCKTFDYVKQCSPTAYCSDKKSSYSNMSRNNKQLAETMEKLDDEICDDLPPENEAVKPRKKRRRNRKRKGRHRKAKPSPDSDPTSPLVAHLRAIDLKELHSNSCTVVNFGCRARLPSDCESEDSFIVFGDENISVYPQPRQRLQSDCKSEDSFILFDNNSSIDECDGVPRKRVRFASEEHLCEVHPMIQWSYAYHKARKGPWEQYALDRMRFKNRVSQVRLVLDPILDPWHRNRVYKERFEESS